MKTTDLYIFRLAILCGWLFTANALQAATNCNLVTEIPASECQTLLNLYNSTGGANWTDAPTNNWNVTSAPCYWTGVSCSGGRVVYLSRESKNLSGTLPDLQLPALQYLVLNGNQLSGSVPNFSNLPTLMYLHIENNRLSGSIPNFSNLPALQGIFLSDNQLSGAIPSFTGLTNLTIPLNLYPGNTQLCRDSNTNYAWNSAVNSTVGGFPVCSTGSYTLTVNKSGSGTVTGIDIDCGNDCTGTYPLGTSITLTAIAQSSLSRFGHWTGCDSTTGTQCIVSMTSAKNVTATFQESLGVKVNGGGTVISSPSAINITPSPGYVIYQSRLFDYGTIVMLTATPPIGGYFTGWGGCDSTGVPKCGCDSVNGTQCTVSVTAFTEVTASFNTTQQTLNINTSGAGTVTGTGINCGADCSENYTPNSNVTLTATPASGYQFGYWSGDCGGTSTSTNVTMNAAKNCTAIFTQIPCTYSISPISRSHTANAETGSVSVSSSNSSCVWNASSNASWAGITSGNSGTGNGTMYYYVGANSSASNRSGSLTIAGQTFTLNQTGAAACTYSISPISGSHTANAENGMVSVIPSNSSCIWNASSNASWANITSGNSGTGNGTVYYSVGANSSTSNRSSSLTIAGQTFTLNQTGLTACTYSISPISGSHTANAENGMVSVIPSNSSCAWNASSNASWAGITSGNSGTGSGTAYYSLTTNPSASSRTGTIIIAGQTFTVTQAGISCTYSLSASSATLTSANATTGSVNVTPSSSACTWTAVSNASWITPTISSGKVDYSIAANTGTSNRTGTVIIAGQTFTVTQPAPCTYALSPTNYTHAAIAGTGSVSLTLTPSGCVGSAWTATSNADWISVTSGESGTGSDTVKFSVQAYNSGVADRTGALTIAGQIFTVTQSVPSSYNLTYSISGSGKLIDGSYYNNGYYYYNAVPSGAKTYQTGLAFNVMTEANTGWVFDKWGGDCSGIETTCQLTMNGDKNIIAIFKRVQRELVVTKPVNGIISSTGIDCGIDCSESYDIDSQVTLTAKPDVGFIFKSWTDDCSSGTISTFNITMNSAKSCGAIFEKQRFNVEVKTDYLSVSGGGSYEFGAPVTLTTTPDANYDVSWSPTPCASSFIMPDKNLVCTATFTLKQFTLNVNKPINGTVTANGINCGGSNMECSKTYDINTKFLLTATPNEGFIFKGWSGENCNFVDVSLLINMGKNRTCTATFEKQPAGVTVNKIGNGQVSGAGAYSMGATVTLIATSDPESDFKGWSPSPCANSFVMPDKNLICTATFTLKQFTLNVNKPINGTVTANGINCGGSNMECSKTYDINTKFLLTATPHEGFIFKGWSGENCNFVDVSLLINMGKNRTCTATFEKQICNYALSTTTANYNANANYGSLEVSAPNGCPWSLTQSDWIATGVKEWRDALGTGRGTLNYSFLANTTASPRTGVIKIGDKTFTITQQPNQPPVANFTTSALTGNVPLKVDVDASSSSDPEGSALTYDWKTINGQTSVDKATSFVFNQEGTYTITLIVKDTLGATHSKSVSVTVVKPNCVFSLPQSYSPLLKAEGENHNFAVNVNMQTGCPWNAALSGATWISFVSSNGEKDGTVSYKVEPNPDTKERTGIITVSDKIFTVKQAGKTSVVPIAQFTASSKLGEIPFQVNLDASKSYDPDGGSIVKYEWLAVKDGHIMFTAQGKEAFFRFDQEGIYSITLTVTDNEGQATETSQTVNAGVSELSFNTYRCAISDLNGFAGCQINSEEKPYYTIGSKLKVTLKNQMATNRFERLDLWVAVQLPKNEIFNQELMFRVSNPLKLFEAYQPPNYKGEAFMPNVEFANREDNVLEFDVPLHFSGKYVFYAIYATQGKNPLPDFDGKPSWRSNLAIKEITLE